MLTKAHAFGPREVCLFSFLVVFEIWSRKILCWSIWLCGVEFIHRGLRFESGFADYEVSFDDYSRLYWNRPSPSILRAL